MYSEVSRFFLLSFSSIRILSTLTWQDWYNNPDFPTDSGHDPMVGQTGRDNFSSNHFMTGMNSEDPSTRVTFPTRFVQSRGGEYFFVPSLATLAKMMMKEDE
jgi:hypothetical protein